MYHLFKQFKLYLLLFSYTNNISADSSLIFNFVAPTCLINSLFIYFQYHNLCYQNLKVVWKLYLTLRNRVCNNLRAFSGTCRIRIRFKIPGYKLWPCFQCLWNRRTYQPSWFLASWYYKLIFSCIYFSWSDYSNRSSIIGYP